MGVVMRMSEFFLDPPLGRGDAKVTSFVVVAVFF